MNYYSNFLGEFIGTFILVFLGCGAVASTILFSAHIGLFQVAIIWGIGVALAIYATRHLSCAHLNPAVSIAMTIGKRMDLKKLPIYLLGQFLGAFLASIILYLLFFSSIAHFEQIHQIIRGTPESVKTAKIFGDFYSTTKISMLTAFLSETFGTFCLVFIIFSFTEDCNIGRPDNSLTPLFIGLTVTAIISVLAPLSQAGLNPARDFAPRLLAIITGWGKTALPDTHEPIFF